MTETTEAAVSAAMSEGYKHGVKSFVSARIVAAYLASTSTQPTDATYSEAEKTWRQHLGQANREDWMSVSFHPKHMNKIVGELDRLRAASTSTQPTAEAKTGWPPGMLQDDSKQLSKWLSNTPNARQHARDAVAPPPVAGDVETITGHLKWALSALNLVGNKLRATGSGETDTQMINLAAAQHSIKAALDMSPSKKEGV